MLTVTLSDVRRHSPCDKMWKRLLSCLGVTRANKHPLPLERILEINDLDDALWVLRAVKGHDVAIRLFACYCAKCALDIFERGYPDDKRPRKAIETAERFVRGLATNEELVTARAAADTAGEELRWLHARIVAREAAGFAAGFAEGDATVFAAQFAAGLAEGGATWAAVFGAAPDAVRDDFKREFIRLCRLEGEYAAFRKI